MLRFWFSCAGDACLLFHSSIRDHCFAGALHSIICLSGANHMSGICLAWSEAHEHMPCTCICITYFMVEGSMWTKYNISKRLSYAKHMSGIWLASEYMPYIWHICMPYGIYVCPSGAKAQLVFTLVFTWTAWKHKLVFKWFSNWFSHGRSRFSCWWPELVTSFTSEHGQYLPPGNKFILQDWYCQGY